MEAKSTENLQKGMVLGVAPPRKKGKPGGPMTEEKRGEGWVIFIQKNQLGRGKERGKVSNLWVE